MATNSTSFTNTPQARDDSFFWTEDELLISGLFSNSIVTLNVMSNDSGGNARRLFSIDDGSGNAIDPAELLNADGVVNGVSAWEATEAGNYIRINNGAVELMLSGSLAGLGATSVDALGADDHIHDEFVYAIRLGNGTLSWAHVTFDLQGQNDAATIAGDTAGSLGEDDTDPATGTLTVTDPDHDQSHTQAVTDAVSLGGLGTYSVDANGNWSYAVNNAAVQHLNANESTTDSFVVYSLDGTAQETVTVTINGENDVVTFSRTDYATGPGPISVAIADLNVDGSQDLVIANGNSFSTDSILLGNGDGSFQGQTTVFVGESHEVVVGDLNGDGKADLVNANSGSGTISSSLGNGDGTFQPRTIYAAGGSGPGSVTLGDLNGDGWLDAVAGNLSSVAVLLGNGDGSFQSQTQYAAAVPQVGAVELGDLNGDGQLDLVVGTAISSTVSVLLGNGDGSFQAPTQNATGSGMAWGLEIGDLNGDGNLDIVAANGAVNTVSVLLGNGDGSFQFQTQYATGMTPLDLALADLNGDGNLDIATANVGDDTLSVLLGNGDGSFQAQTQYAAGINPLALAIADLNGDGGNDVAVTNGDGNNVSVFLNTSDWIV